MPLPPIRREVIVAVTPERAFEVFTDELSAWWPMQGHSVFGPGSLVSFEDKLLVERTVDGSEAIWGEVQEWVPGERLRLSWHPGGDAVSEVTVTFSATDGGTRVSLEHTGWEAYSEPETARDEYGEGWPPVLDLFREHSESDRLGDDTWVALMHTPGASAPSEGSLFADPRFGEHVAFLERMQTAGYLVAAGPFTDADEGSGMTILHLAGPDRLAEVTRLATEDDGAVASGLLAVQVRPWNVIFDTTS